MVDETQELTIREQQEQEAHRDVDETMRDSQWHIHRTDYQSVRVEDEEEAEWEDHDQVDLIIYSTDLDPNFLSSVGRTVERWEYYCRFAPDPSMVGLQSRIQAALLMIQAARHKVHLSVMFSQGMFSPVLAGKTSTLMHFNRRHRLSLRQS